MQTQDYYDTELHVIESHPHNFLAIAQEVGGILVLARHPEDLS